MANECYGKGVTGIRYTTAAPVAAVNEQQTLTIGGTPTGGTFQLAYNGFATTPITWVNVNATLLASINSALNALPSLGTSWCVATAGTVTAGIGTIILTFSGGDVAGRNVNTITVPNNSMTGTSPTATVAETTPGVSATGLGAQPGTLLVDSTNGKLYLQTGTAAAPVWTAQA